MAVALFAACGLASNVRAADAAGGAFGQPGTVKVRVPNALAAAAVAQSGDSARTVAAYEAFTVLEVPSDHVPAMDALELLSEENFILLNALQLDTTKPETKALQQMRGDFAGRAMHMVQFAGPVQERWLNAVTATGVEVVTYIPSNAYVVYGTAAQIAALQQIGAREGFVQWNGEYKPEYRIHPDALALSQDPVAAASNDVLFAVQLVKDEAQNAETLATLKAASVDVPLQDYDMLNYRNVVIAMSPAMLSTIAALPDVVSIQHYIMPEKNDERQGQIMAGNITGNLPSGTGYLAWLGTMGFTQAQFTASGFAVDVSDSGLDNGTTSPNHFGLYQTGVRPGTSRVLYNRLVGTAHAGSTLKGCDGHGTLNTHIVAGYNTLATSPHIDAAGYHYGLGICPFVKVGSSVIFDPSTFTSPNYASLQSQAYNNGARISTNSWGAAVGGAYNTDSQSYDALVRDAQPTGSTVPAAGNQEMVICFSAGNSGSGANTIGSPGTGKNVITVGAAENVQAFGGADGCGIADSGADSLNDIISFSSRGPCDDNRRKPDIMAPGTHVSGGVTQQASPGTTGLADTCFTATGVCGGVGANHFFPAGQQWYSASSGTSHSCPGVAGAAALVRQFFINSGMNPASPAMTKAVMLNSARYMTGVGANDTLYSNNQGMGEINLGSLFDRTSTTTTFRDQIAGDIFTAAGQTRVFSGSIGTSTKPFRVTLAWTDAPGATSGNAYKNNLDLTVTVGANTYRGNVFSGANSITGGTADTANNVESVFIPAGISGSYTVTVTAANINSDGVPNSGTATDQDFALVIYNGVACTGASVTSSPAARTVCRGGSTTFIATGAGTGTLGYQWRKDTVNLSGQTASTYTITAAAAADAGSYDCVISNACGSATTTAAVLTVCVGDYNCDSVVDFFDYIDFVDDFASSRPFADVNLDSTIDFFDYLDFVDAFTAGC